MAVVDTGIDASHSEFLGHRIQGTNFGNDTSGIGYESNDHGTHVASIICANRNAFGMRGVAYDASLYDYRVGPNNSEGYLSGLGPDRETAAVFQQAVIDNIDVINNSWGSETPLTTYTANRVSRCTNTASQPPRRCKKTALYLFLQQAMTRVSKWTFGGGMPYFATELVDSWLTVVTSNDTNTEAS